MIVKVELIGENNNGWRFIDGVDNLESRYRTGKNANEQEYFERELLIFKNGVCDEKLTLNAQTVYLLNNEGKTIERIN